MAKKKKNTGGGKLGTIIITAIVVVALCVFVPKVVHKCDHCGKTFFGTGYAPNLISEAFSDEEIICEDCEKEEYVLLGVRIKDKEENKLPLFPSSVDKEQNSEDEVD